MMRHVCTLIVWLVLSAVVVAGEPVVVAPSPEAQAAAEEAARKAALESIRVQAQTEKNILEAISQLGSPSWERASQRLIAIGGPAVPYLIEAMNNKSSGAFPAESYPLAGPGRATRTLPMKEAAFAVLTSLFQNHSTFNGALPGLDATAWREFWTHAGASVQFGKPQ
jgi:hypothetical protein